MFEVFIFASDTPLWPVIKPYKVSLKYLKYLRGKKTSGPLQSKNLLGAKKTAVGRPSGDSTMIVIRGVTDVIRGVTIKFRCTTVLTHGPVLMQFGSLSVVVRHNVLRNFKGKQNKS